jgi:membrane associated rhomboid family serine protease
MRELTEKEIAQEERVYAAWIQRWEQGRQEGESLQAFTARQEHESKMHLMYNMMMMLEGKPESEQVYQQAQARYKYYAGT